MTSILDLSVRALFALDPVPEVAGQRAADALNGTGTTEENEAPSPPTDARGLLLEAAFALAARQLAELLRALPLERTAAALRERDPGAAVAGLLADSALERAAATSGDPLTVALLSGARRKRELLAQAGGALTTAEVAGHLGISRQGVDKRRQAGTLLGVRMPAGEWVYPAAQFGADGAPLEGLSEVLAAFRIDSPWLRLEHLLAPDPMLGPAGAVDERPRSALQALREDGPSVVPAAVAAVRQVGDLGE